MENKDEEPIFSFEGLKDVLRLRGYTIDDTKGAYTPIIPEDVTREEIEKGKIDFKDTGIFVIDENGEHRQIYLYKRKYHLDKYGKPRYHICKCDTIDIFLARGSFQKEYRRANTETVPVIDLDDENKGKDKQISNLPLCKNCVYKMMQQGLSVSSSMDSEEFVELLKQTGQTAPQQEVEVDIFGYTKDWEQINRKYRESKDYTCERCGIHIENPYDRQFIHVHHKNGNRLDNRLVNLECLCIRCHSEVDDVHRKNFSSAANKIQLEEFNQKYPEPEPKNETFDNDRLGLNSY